MKTDEESRGDELGEMAPFKSYLGSPKRIICQFILFAICFSLNHGCVTGILAYVQVFFGDVAQISVAVLYGVYVGSALFMSALIVDWAGPKFSLLYGLTLYCIYVAAYAIGGGFPSVQTPVIVGAAVVGGFSAGFLWTAQGPYFKAFADQYAKATNSPREKSTGMFAGIFAFVYLSCEVLLKLIAKPAFTPPSDGSAVTLRSPGVVALFSVYAIVAIVACIGIMFVPEVPVDAKAKKVPWFQKFLSVLKLLFTNPLVVLLGPAQCCFGFCVELMGLYISVEISKCSGSFGVDWFANLPWFATSIPAIAAIMQVPVGLLVKKFGDKAVAGMMILGLLSFAAIGAICIWVTRDELAGWGYTIVILFVLQGFGRSAYEGANRATYAAMFTDEDASAAFASITLFAGTASTIAYATFKDFLFGAEVTNCTFAGAVVPSYDGVTMGWVCFICSIVGLAGYVTALLIHNAGRRKKAQMEKGELGEAAK